jgi:hypothetical protein
MYNKCNIQIASISEQAAKCAQSLHELAESRQLLTQISETTKDNRVQQLQQYVNDAQKVQVEINETVVSLSQLVCVCVCVCVLKHDKQL